MGGAKQPISYFCYASTHVNCQSGQLSTQVRLLTKKKPVMHIVDTFSLSLKRHNREGKFWGHHTQVHIFLREKSSLTVI